MRGSQIFPISGPMVRSHVSLKMVFGLIVIRRTTFLSWSRVLSTASSSSISSATTTPLPQDSTGSVPIPSSVDNERADEQERVQTQPKIQRSIKMRITHTNGETRLFPKYLNGCKNSRRISVDGSVLEHKDSPTGTG